jgi:hypothetical protein
MTFQDKGAKRVGFADWAKPQRLYCFGSSRTTRKHPLQPKKKSRRGGNSKNKAKGFSGGVSAGVPAQAAGLSLRASLEIGSR